MNHQSSICLCLPCAPSCLAPTDIFMCQIISYMLYTLHSSTILILLCICVCVHTRVCTCVHHGTCVQVTGQLSRVVPSFCSGFWGWNSNSAEPSCQPKVIPIEAPFEEGTGIQSVLGKGYISLHHNLLLPNLCDLILKR